MSEPKTYMDIPFNQLSKAAYNREIKRAHVNRIRREFDPDMVQPAIVSFRDGKYWIIDHQHQSQAIYELNGKDPNTLINCDVRHGMTYEQEAALFMKLNTGQMKLKRAEEIIGAIEAKDEDAVRFKNVVEDCGYSIGGNKKNVLEAIAAAWKIFEKVGGSEKLACILSITHECWLDDKCGVNCNILNGLDKFLYVHGEEYNRTRLVNALSPIDPRTVVRRADTFYKQMDSKQYNKSYCTYWILVTKYYNAGLRKNKLTPAAPGF